MKRIDLSHILPASKKGLFEISHFTLTEDEVKMERIRDAMNRRAETMGLEAGVKYTRLTHVHRGIIMSNTPMEIVTNDKIMRLAHGNVLIAGLGLGMVVLEISKKVDVEGIIVVEKEQEVIDLVGPHVLKHTACPIIIEHRDIFKFKEHARSYFDSIYDTIYFDIWDDIGADNWEEMKILKRMYRSLLYEGGKAWMGCWREETMANMARDERATERIHRSIIEHRRSAAL